MMYTARVAREGTCHRWIFIVSERLMLGFGGFRMRWMLLVYLHCKERMLLDPQKCS